MDALAHLVLCLALTQPVGVENWAWETDYQTAYKRAEPTKKTIVVLIGAKWCHACPAMKRAAAAVLNKHPEVVPLYLDYDANEQLCRTIKVSTVVPELIVYDWVHPAERLIGQFKTEQLEKLLEKKP